MTSAFDLSEFEIIREFKGNASNQIHLIRHRQSGEQVIHKRIKIYNLPCQLREIQAQKNLRHDYIIQLLDYSVQTESLELFIEYANHGDLFEFINSLEFIKESILLRLFYKIVIAVEFIHSNGFIHRDIKPENVLIGDGFEPKLADFGSSVMQQIVRNTFCGTYEYMAPEIYQRERQTQKVDIWALGILLFEMTHNKMPFRDKTMLEVRDLLASKAIPFDKQISGRIRNVVEKILQFDPERRPSAQEILCFPELKYFFDEMPEKLPFISPTPPSPGQQIMMSLQSKQELCSEAKQNHYKHLKSQKELEERDIEKERVKKELLLFKKQFKLPAKLKLEPLRGKASKKKQRFDDSSDANAHCSVHQKMADSEEKSTFYCEVESHDKLNAEPSPKLPSATRENESQLLNRSENALTRVESSPSGASGALQKLKIKIMKKDTPKLRHARLQLLNSEKTTVRNLVSNIKKEMRRQKPKTGKRKASPLWKASPRRSRSPKTNKKYMFSFNATSAGKRKKANQLNYIEKWGDFDDYKFGGSTRDWAKGDRRGGGARCDSQSSTSRRNKGNQLTVKKKKAKKLKRLQFKDFESKLKKQPLLGARRVKPAAPKRGAAMDFGRIKKGFLKSTFNSPFGYSTFSNRTSKKLKQKFFAVSKVAKRAEKQAEGERTVPAKADNLESYFSTRSIWKPQLKAKAEIFGVGKPQSKSKTPNVKKGARMKSTSRQRKFKKVGVSVESKRRNWILGL